MLGGGDRASQILLAGATLRPEASTGQQLTMLFKRPTGSSLEPLCDVTLLKEDESGSVFRAVGDDPRMIWRPDSQMSNVLDGRSAVRVRIVMAVVEGVLREPCVYFDWGDGFSEETRKALSQISPGQFAAVGSSNAGACRAIRFDPSAAACIFKLQSLEVEVAGARSDYMPRLSLARRLSRRLLRRLPAGVQVAARKCRQFLERPQGWFPALSGSGGAWRTQYVQAFKMARNFRSQFFSAPPLDPPSRDPEDAAIIAFYLPQFSPTPENDIWWGRGFTEWTNVSKATPQFLGHYQPRLPGDLGFYDLRIPEIRRRQADLARKTGVNAFCFYYYWFNGRRVLDAPLDAFVTDPEIDLPFALCWANENWTRRWDGLENEILLAQSHSPADDEAVVADLARYIQNERYWRISGRPLLIIYRPDTLPNAKGTVRRWRETAQRLGLGELFLLCTDAFGYANYEADGFDGLVEFPPHGISIGEISQQVQFLNPQFTGRVYDYEAVVLAKEADLAEASDPRRFPGVMPAWDNEARKPGAGHSFHRATPALFQRWVCAALDNTRRCAPLGIRLVFVNAWNEWAEGAYLEPDRWFGYGFAQALRSALQERAPKTAIESLAVVHSHKMQKRHEGVILLHIFYPDLIEEMASIIRQASTLLDAMVSFPDTWDLVDVERLSRALPEVWLQPVRNRGRDFEPFLYMLKLTRTRGYKLFCKIHSKKSPHLADGPEVRNALLHSLLELNTLKRGLELFSSNPTLGLLAPASSRMEIGDPDTMFNNRGNVEFLAKRLGFVYRDNDVFAGGSMFWGRVRAFDLLASPKATDLPFELEMGRIDGTLAHALERVMGAIVRSAGFQAEFLL